MNDFLTAKEVAKILGVAQSTAARLMARNEIRSFKLGPRLTRTTKLQIHEYVKRQFLSNQAAPNSENPVLD